jgi:hypothetical protein
VTQNVVWQPQEGPQTSLLQCPCFEVFFGGARGGGKTDAVLGEFINHAGTYGKDAIGLMVRRTRTELVETIERSRMLYTLLGAKFNDTDKMWRFPNGARLRFAYLERDADADAYQGHSYTRLYVEEAGTFPSIGPILKLMATLRSGAGVPVGLRLTGNPGGPGQGWVKSRYIDPNPQGYEIFKRTFEDPWSKKELTTDWVYIPSRIKDNKFLDSNYIARISQSGSPQLVKAWLEGDFNAIEGAFFDNWDTAKHVIPPFVIPEDWIRFRSMDWGAATPFSVGWWAIAGDDTTIPVIGDAWDHDGNGDAARNVRIPRGCLVRYREWYGCVEGQANKGLKLTAEEVGLGIKERELGENIRYGVLDPSAFAEAGGPSYAERMQKAAGVKFREADNKRVSRGTHVGSGPMGGWDQMRARLNGNADGLPMIVCFETCYASIRTIPVMQHDRDKPEDLDTEGEDHAADEWRYACMSRPWNRPKADPIKKSFTDYKPKHVGPAAGDWMSY